jgi:hypothetical protein
MAESIASLTPRFFEEHLIIGFLSPQNFSITPLQRSIAATSSALPNLGPSI